MDGKAAQADIPMETDDVVVEKVSKQAASGGAVASKPSAVSSGLPQSKDELEALVKAIHHTVSNSVLPRLHKCLTAKVQNTHTHTYILSYISLNNCGSVCLQVQRDEEHKAVKSKDVKDEEVARIPIAFAMVKLMQTLPPNVMEANLPGYVCTSPTMDVFKTKNKKTLLTFYFRAAS